jgi:hypothetical protein
MIALSYARECDFYQNALFIGISAKQISLFAKQNNLFAKQKQ